MKTVQASCFSLSFHRLPPPPPPPSSVYLSHHHHPHPSHQLITAHLLLFLLVPLFFSSPPNGPTSFFSPAGVFSTCAPTSDSTAGVKVKSYSSKSKSASVSSNGVADSKQKKSEATAESPSLEQASNQAEVKSEVSSVEHNKQMSEAESVLNALERKTSESDAERTVVEPCETLNGGEPKEVENEEAKNKSTSLPAEGTGKSDKFSYTRILRGIPHNPHFTPLESYSKRSREKLILGWDEIFEEAIDQIQSLTTKTFSTNVQELWKTVAELENLGYNVARLKKRLDELTDMMKRRKSSEIEVSEWRAKADEYRKEKKKIEEDIADLQAQADNAQVMIDELVDQAEKMELNLPTVDELFENIAKNPL